LNALIEMQVKADGATFGGMRSGRDHFNKGVFAATSLRLSNSPKGHRKQAVLCRGLP
jgi:hypothetical protein